MHFVGHSLGGLVIHRFLEQFPAQPPGNAVFLGTPVRGQPRGRAAARFGPVAQLMGQSVAEELLQPHERAGRMRARSGSWRAPSRSAWDSCWRASPRTMTARSAVSETRMPGATDHIALPVSHLGMLMSARVARETGLFLTQGHFSLR